MSMSTSQTFRSWVVIFHLRWPMPFLSLSLYSTTGRVPRMNVSFWGSGDSKLIKQGYILERLKSSFTKFYCRYGDLILQYVVSLSRMLNDNLTLDQLQWPPNRSGFPPISWPWYRAWLSTNFDWFPWSICNGCMTTGNAYPCGYLVPCPLWGLTYAPIGDTSFT